ncbi:hypothetical protein HN51_055523, partial [Arachis hypogaea]
MNQLFTQRSSYLSRSRLSLLSPTRTAHLASPSRTLEAAYCVTVSARVVVIGSGLLLARPLFSGKHQYFFQFVMLKCDYKKNKANNNKNNHHGANGEDTVLITPVPRFPDKSDDTAEMKICLSKVYKVEKVELSEDRMVAGSTKGYRMVRPTRGVVEGAWYFEIRVLHLGETGHTQLGWSTEKSDFAGT